LVPVEVAVQKDALRHMGGNPHWHPESGKGENSWDCGEDALYRTGISGKTKAEGHDIGRAAAHVRECSLQTRAKRGDPECWPMSPEDRAIQLEKQRAERAAQEK